MPTSPQDFLMNILVFSEITSENTINSNFFTTERNFENLSTWLTELQTYLTYLQGLTNIDTIFANVLENYKTQKNSILLSYTIGIGNTVSQIIGTTTYLIKCVDQYTFEITNSTNSGWNVDNLIIQIKNANGQIMYPNITTLNNKITIVFDSPINIDTKLFFI